jgi:hypothetical protein
MSILPFSARLQNQTADVRVSGVNPVTFSPLHGQWSGCVNQNEADEKGQILAVVVANSILDFMQSPGAFLVASSSGGGYVVNGGLNVWGLSSVPMMITLPNAISDFDARGKAWHVLFEIARDTVAAYWGSLVNLVAQSPGPSQWPAWGVEVRKRWLHP